MVVEYELREPLLRTKTFSEGQRKEAQRAWLIYVTTLLISGFKIAYKVRCSQPYNL
jgi:hypothetical protein